MKSSNSWSRVTLASCWRLKLRCGAARLEILLLLFPVAADFVLLEKLLMFLPEEFRLLLKAVGPGWQHRGGMQACFTASGNAREHAPMKKGSVEAALTGPSPWIRCRFLLWLDLSRPWSCYELLPTSWHAKNISGWIMLHRLGFSAWLKKTKNFYFTWRRWRGLRCWAAWQWRSSRLGTSSCSCASATALLTSPAREPDGTAPSNACSPCGRQRKGEKNRYNFSAWR